MKKKCLKRLAVYLVVGTMSAAIVSPVSVYAENEVTQDTAQQGEECIEVLSDSVGTIIYDEAGIKVTISQVYYEGDTYTIKFMVENNSEKDVFLRMVDEVVEGCQVGFAVDGGFINSGNKAIKGYYLHADELTQYGIYDFDVAEATLCIEQDSNVIYEKPIKMYKEAFEGAKEVSQPDTEEAALEQENAELEKEIEALKGENEELKSQNASMTTELESLEAKVQELEENKQQLEQEKQVLEEKVKVLEEGQQGETAVEGESSEPTEENEAETQNTEATPAAQGESEQNAAPVEYTDAATIRIVQQALNDTGYACGNPDGVAGAKTREAITAYQSEKGITVNGIITDELIESLGVVDKVVDAVVLEAEKATYSDGYTYEQLARNPDAYIMERMKITGKVLQAESGEVGYARVAMNSDYDTVVFVTFTEDVLDYRLLEDDMITIYGQSNGVYTYEAVSGASITLPWINAHIIEMQ